MCSPALPPLHGVLYSPTGVRRKSEPSEPELNSTNAIAPMTTTDAPAAMPATAAVGSAAAALLPPLGAVALFEGDIELVLVADRETDAVEVELAVVVPVAVCVALAVALDDAVLVATGAV